MKKFSRVLAALLVVLTLVPSIALAASKEKPKASTSEYIRVYAFKNSGDNKGRLYGYSDEALTKKSTKWIRVKADSSHDADECRIVAISSNGKAIKLSYPLDSGGRATAWFERKKFTSFDLTEKYEYVSLSEKVNIYRYADGKGDYGYAVSNNSSDKVYILGTDSSGKYYQLIYKLDSGVWKMGWAKKSELKKETEPKPDDGKTDSPVTDFWKPPFKEGTYYPAQSFGNKANSRTGRPYHSGWDIVYNGDDEAAVFAVADGTVKYKGGKRNDNGNGLHVIIEHTFNGKTVYSLYSHLDSYSACPSVGSKVSQGKKIGIMGNTGASNGAHLHLGIFADGYMNSPWGYTDVDSDTSMFYDGITYYNPKMVIDNDKLP